MITMLPPDSISNKAKIIEIDIVILSFAKNEYLKQLTKQTVDTLLASEDKNMIHFNVLVIESEKSIFPFQFPGTTTIYPNEKFGFNRYMNIGIKMSNSPFVCLCNNDLIFHKEWASEILRIMEKYPDIMSANPYCPNLMPHFKIFRDKEMIIANKKNESSGILSGFCIFTNRALFTLIGLFDEQFEFWYADKDYGKTLLKHNIKHALVIKSTVEHLSNQSYSTFNVNQKLHFTEGQKALFIKKWQKKSMIHKMYRLFLRKNYS